jgi:hypothetical protein
MHVLVCTVPEHVATLFILWFGKGVSVSPLCPHRVCNPLSLPPCGYQEHLAISLTHLASYPVDTKISSLHLYLTWPPILWIPRSRHYMCISLGLLSCGYEDLVTISVSHLASYPVDMKISSLHVYLTWPPILWI